MCGEFFFLYLYSKPFLKYQSGKKPTLSEGRNVLLILWAWFAEQQGISTGSSVPWEGLGRVVWVEPRQGSRAGWGSSLLCVHFVFWALQVGFVFVLYPQKASLVHISVWRGKWGAWVLKDWNSGRGNPLLQEKMEIPLHLLEQLQHCQEPTSGSYFWGKVKVLLFTRRNWNAFSSFCRCLYSAL